MTDIRIPKAYRVVGDSLIEELKSRAILLKHIKSGARIAILSNEDTNKVFHIAFRTPPTDSTGVAHILEHSVLCGSRDFPVKDPFVELVKGSLNTFLNAMTYSDKTVYPVASCNDADFQNLMHIYLDAVFYPNIYKHKEIFLQEGWHYEMDQPDGELKYNGVVYNEMKGAFSSPEQILFRKITETLFPDTTYGVESGGDPKNIPDLTYEDFLDFHRKYYHPSNAWIYLYGDMDVEEKLDFMDREYLSDFDEAPIDSRIRMQDGFKEMHRVEAPYAVSAEESTENNTYLSYNMVIGTSLDRELYLAMQVLEYVLMSSPGAVLKKALIESGIGQDVFGEFDNGILQPYMSIIVKNAKTSDKDRFLQVIRDTLTRLVEEGIPKRSLKAAVNYYEFKYREGDFGRYPVGLMYGLQMMDSWLYDENQPFIHIQAGDTFEKLKKLTDTDYFETLIQRWLLDNTHSSLLVLYPEKGLNEAEEARVAAVLAEKKEAMGAAGRKAVCEACQQLKAYQEAPDRKEDIEKIPVLKISDIEKNCRPFHNREISAKTMPILCHGIETRGIAYTKLLFDMGQVCYADVPYAGLLAMLLGNLNTEDHSYTELSDNMNIATGGITAAISLYPEYQGGGRFKVMFEVSMKSLENKVDEGMAIIKEILCQSRFSDTTRIKELIGQIKSRLEMMMNGNGHTVAVNRANSYQSAAALYKEAEEGIEYYRFIEKLHSHFDEMKETIAEKLEETAALIFRKEQMMADYTGLSDAARLLGRSLERLAEGLEKRYGQTGGKARSDRKEPAGEDMNWPEGLKEAFEAMRKRKSEAFITSGTVQYNACVGDFLSAGHDYHGALNILKVIMSYDYLWNNIRVKGGAYGCMCGFASGGTGYFTSYRDPHLAETYKIYENAADYVRHFDADERTMRKYIIGAFSGVDIPLNASAAGTRSLNAWMTKTPIEFIQKNRDEMLSANVDTIRSLAGIVESVTRSGLRCAVGSASAIEANKDMFDHVETLIK